MGEAQDDAAAAAGSAPQQPLGRGPDSVAAAEAAVPVLEPLGSTVELARAYSSLAHARMCDEAPGLRREGTAIILDHLPGYLNSGAPR